MMHNTLFILHELCPTPRAALIIRISGQEFECLLDRGELLSSVLAHHHRCLDDM